MIAGLPPNRRDPRFECPDPPLDAGIEPVCDQGNDCGRLAYWAGLCDMKSRHGDWGDPRPSPRGSGEPGVAPCTGLVDPSIVVSSAVAALVFATTPTMSLNSMLSRLPESAETQYEIWSLHTLNHLLRKPAPAAAPLFSRLPSNNMSLSPMRSSLDLASLACGACLGPSKDILLINSVDIFRSTLFWCLGENIPPEPDAGWLPGKGEVGIVVSSDRPSCLRLGIVVHFS
mmetsp:Transcript_36847/g.86710  ORF Transcript_36847/g.86710 Transcript_36847/m.86710 type:complete len:229 (-) Transcript_36847:51-737(-)